MTNVKPKKKLGQHFLIDQNISRKIVALLNPEPSSTIVEIGPGMGVLTQYFPFSTNPAILIEIDSESVDYLKEHFPQGNLSIRNEDILRMDLKTHIPQDSYFIGNLPYNISSPIFFTLLENLSHCKKGVFMIQKEVAERICSDPGNKTFGILSVLLGHYFNIKYEFSVSNKVFNPPPKVMSAVISLERKENSTEINLPDLKKVVKEAFSQRRKQLKNSLKNLGLSNFPSLDKYSTKRPEQLSVDDFVDITRTFFNHE